MSRPAAGCRGLLLDADDTLFDTRAAMVAAGRAAAGTLWPEAGAEVHAALGTRFHADPSGWFPRFTSGELSFAQMRARRVADLGQAFTLPRRRVEDFEAAYAPVFARSLRPFDDVEPLLQWCEDEAVPVGVLTNSSSAYTAQKLSWSGLEGRFAAVVTRDTLGYGKPHPAVFRHACAELGVPADETAYVGDDPVIDARAASEADLRGVWLRRSATLPPPAAGSDVVASLVELPRLLRPDTRLPTLPGTAI